MLNKDVNEQCDGGAIGSTPADQAGDGGSTPTPSLEFRVGDTAAARALVLEFHYSRRVKCGGRTVGTFHRTDRAGLCVASCIFHETSVRWREPVLELHRLVRRPNYAVPLSQLVALTCRAVKRAGIADLLISYADSTPGHHGGIYQASGWHFHTKRKPSIDGWFKPDGTYVPGRSAHKAFGTNSKYKLQDRGLQPHWDTGKYLYWRALTPSGEAKAERLGFLKLPYPKPTPAKVPFPRAGR